MIAIIDYGMGNIHSVQKALESFGQEVIVASTAMDIDRAQKLVLPGVGAFDDAMQELEKKNLIFAIKENLKKRKIFLGICLGMQLLFETSEEAKEKKGLGLLQGGVKRFENKKGLKIPHMGWNQLKIAHQLISSSAHQDCPLLNGIPDNSYVYFCHSYYPAPKSREAIAASTEYGIGFPSVVWRDNIYGVQFHPEKSQETGLKILKNFVGLC